MSHSSDHHGAQSKIDDERWKIFTDALQKVQRQVHPNLCVKMEALQYIEKLIIDLLHTMCNAKPCTVQDVVDQVQKTFPKPIDRWAIQDANNALTKRKQKKGDKSGVTLPIDKVHPLLKDLLGYRLDHQVTLYIVAVLEYVAADILKLVGNYVRNIHATEITEEDVRVSMCADKVLNNMFFSNDSDDASDASGASIGRQESRLLNSKILDELKQSYEELVKDLIVSEHQYIRELELIIKVFRPPFVELFPQSKDIDVIFSNILDIHSFSLHLLSSLEDTVEITEQDQIPFVGGCFEELAEGAEFDVYEKYMADVTNAKLRDRLYALLQRSDITNKLTSYESSFKDIVKYLLPKLLEGPIYHLKYCFDVMEKLKESSHDNEEDKESFSQSLGLLMILKGDVDKRISHLSNNTGTANNLRRQNYGLMHFSGRAAASRIMDEIQKSIENWEDKDIKKQCYDFILEGILYVYERNKKDRERHVFLFDNMVLLCKSTGQKKMSSSSANTEYRYKEKFFVKYIDVYNLDDTEELKCAFELQDKSQGITTLYAKTEKEKAEWMAALLSLLFRSTLDRMLDSKLKEEESQQPLILPQDSSYPFAEEDSEENIILEESQTPGEPPLIKGATLNKLIERLTYHKYADPKFVRRFLTTYRSFCSPKELLELLILRYHIPENSELFDDNREALTRFKKEYVKPVQFRVLNVIRLWAEHHFYDFEREVKLLEQLNEFLETIKGKFMRKWVDSIVKILKRRVESSLVFQGISQEAAFSLSKGMAAQFNEEAPPVEWFTAQDDSDKYNVVTLHPIEIARQETLIEFTLYKSVMPSELVGSVFTKKDKDIHCPNLMRVIKHTNRFTYWLEDSILSTKNLEERVAVMSRIIELMIVFRKLNNFNGVLCVVSALDSAPVHRLTCTFEQLKPHYKKNFDEAKELLANNYKKYFETLRAIDPPCVPFSGVYMTNILKLEEGNPDSLPNTELINFSKRRKVADITAEIQQYQNQPYNLKPVESIQTYLKSLDPWLGKDNNSLDEFLYEKSLEIEPRNMRPPPKFSRKYESAVLKSPGIKTLNKNSSIFPSAFKGHIPFPPKNQENKFTFSPKISTTDDEDSRSVTSTSFSSPPTTPNTPVTPPPRTPPPRTPPPNKNTPPRTPSSYGSRSPLLHRSEENILEGSQWSIPSTSTIRQSQTSLISYYTSTSTLASQPPDADEVMMPHYELQPPPLPPRRPTLASSSDLSPPPQPFQPSSIDNDTFSTAAPAVSATPCNHRLEHSQSSGNIYSGRVSPQRIHDLSNQQSNAQFQCDIPPRLPPKLPGRASLQHIETEIPPRLPPRPSRRPIERSGSMHGVESRYSARRNSGDHVNMNGVTPGTPQLPPRTYRPPNHGRQRSQ